ncbi:hypothetical protein BU25DRAFT_411209 [Macroventuria anomochaeta]|uniref:Uncharacterized protein n=1 Tax=Macroventuria anomochaeta TaxID=301207 RepID=A0ACB6S1V9_9PLEO|nr:uncharacterized protein BU25DRAFT_411209 [Macroventuria anomochaeta]KAF2627127.1 hypothetical protein BU25DRAFT_411209 [Macroventuria anomochaeta]
MDTQNMSSIVGDGLYSLIFVKRVLTFSLHRSPHLHIDNSLHPSLIHCPTPRLRYVHCREHRQKHGIGAVK